MKTKRPLLTLLTIVLMAAALLCSDALARSSHWKAIRDKHLHWHPYCAACGTFSDVEVHHIESYRLNPSRELDPDNLITLCRKHHFQIGHDADGPGPRKPRWFDSNPFVRRDAAAELARVDVYASETGESNR